MARADAQRVDEVVQLADEEVDRPEVGAALRVVRAPSVAELVIEDDRAPALGEVGEGEQVVVRGAGPAMEHDQRSGRAFVPRSELAVDAVPRLGRLAADLEGHGSVAHRASLTRFKASG